MIRGERAKRAIAAYDEYVKANGRPPLISEVARGAGISFGYATEVLNKNGRVCRTVPRGKSEKRAESQRAKDEAFIRDYRMLAEHHGRPPTWTEIAAATGRCPGGGMAATLKRLGLEHTRRRFGRKKAEEAESAVEPREAAPTPEQIFALYKAVPSIEKIMSIKGSGDPERRPEILPRAGETYGVQDRIWLDCPVCGRRRLISPRMHPWWLRNREGEAIFVCRDTCTGRTV